MTPIPEIVDTPPTTAMIDASRTYLITEITEVQRDAQLQRQNNSCAFCKSSFAESSNLLFKAVGSALQKPRRCHYCAQHFCHKCHSNKTAMLPFKVVARWDFAEYHVCNSDYDFLTNAYDRPLLYVPNLPVQIRQKPVVERLTQLRGKAVRLHAILSQCREAVGKFVGAALSLQDYHFNRQNYLSLQDLYKIQLSEKGGGVGSVPLPLLGMGGNNNNDLCAFVENFVAKGREHVSRCEKACHPRAVTNCVLCKQGERVVFFDNGDTCHQCGALYHAACLEVLGCPACKAKKAALQQQSSSSSSVAAARK